MCLSAPDVAGVDRLQAAGPDPPPMAYSLPSSLPTKSVPSAPIAGDDLTLLPVWYDHLNAPVAPFSA